MLIDFMDKQPFACELLMNEIKMNMLSHAYLIDGNNSSDLHSFVLSFVKSILCPNKVDGISGCGNCSVCKLIDDHNYPEIKVIKPDGNFIKKGQLIDLQQSFSKSSIYGDKLIYIIYDCEKMRPEAANSMLKFLEEPNSSIIAILLTNNFNNVLTTIISRCQIVKLNNSITDRIDNNFYDISLNFIEEIENKGIESICDEKDLLFNHIDMKNREEITLVVDNMINMYYDMLKLVVDKDSLIKFESFRDRFINLIGNNNLNMLLEKINFLVDIKDSIKFNVNSNLLVDSIILGIGGIKK